MTFEDRIKKLETDMYFGDGMENLPVTARLVRLEDALASITTLKWLLAGAIISSVPNIAAMIIRTFAKQ